MREGQEAEAGAWKHAWVVVPELVLGKLGQENILVGILEIPLFLFLVNHCKLSEQITCSFVEFETFN